MKRLGTGQNKILIWLFLRTWCIWYSVASDDSGASDVSGASGDSGESDESEKSGDSGLSGVYGDQNFECYTNAKLEKDST